MFQRYLRSLKAAAVLPPEEEHRLALAYRDHGDSDAAARLVRGNLRLVVKIAEEYGRSEDQLMDLIQEGNLGLLHALGKFDPDRGVKLSSYAAWWIRAYILKFVLANFRVVRLGTTLAQRKLFYKLRRERERLERDGNEVNVDPAGRGPGRAAHRRGRDGDAAGGTRGVAGRAGARAMASGSRRRRRWPRATPATGPTCCWSPTSSASGCAVASSASASSCPGGNDKSSPSGW